MATVDGNSDTERELTLTAQARRSQLIEVTIGLVAEHGYGQTSLARIAEGAGITKAAVLYHFPSKDALIRIAYEHVLDALTGAVAAAVERASPSDGPAAYARAMIGHLHEHPRHTRMIVEAMTHTDPDHDREARSAPLARIIEAAAQAQGAEGPDSRTFALIIGGAIDAIVDERIHDPHYDTVAAAETLARVIDAALSP